VQNDQRVLQIKMEAFEEVQAKMVPETILSNVRISLLSQFVTDSAVHDPHDGQPGSSMAHAKAIRHADRQCVIPDLSVLPAQSGTKSSALQPEDGTCVHDRGLTGYVGIVSIGYRR
jgi:hypothetical protein